MITILSANLSDPPEGPYQPFTDETVNALNDEIVNRGYGSCPWPLKGGSVAVRSGDAM